MLAIKGLLGLLGVAGVGYGLSYIPLVTNTAERNNFGLKGKAIWIKWGESAREELGISLTGDMINDNKWNRFGGTDLEFKGYKLEKDTEIIKGEGERGLCFKTKTPKGNLCWQKGKGALSVVGAGDRLINQVKSSTSVYLKDLEFKVRCDQDGDVCFGKPASEWKSFVRFVSQGRGTEWNHDVTRLQKE